MYLLFWIFGRWFFLFLACMCLLSDFDERSVIKRKDAIRMINQFIQRKRAIVRRNHYVIGSRRKDTGSEPTITVLLKNFWKIVGQHFQNPWTESRACSATQGVHEEKGLQRIAQRSKHSVSSRSWITINKHVSDQSIFLQIYLRSITKTNSLCWTMPSTSLESIEKIEGVWTSKISLMEKQTSSDVLDQVVVISQICCTIKTQDLCTVEMIMVDSSNTNWILQSNLLN